MMMRFGSGSAPLFVAMWCGWRLDESDDARRRGTTTTHTYTPGVCVVLACASLFLLFGPLRLGLPPRLCDFCDET